MTKVGKTLSWVTEKVKGSGSSRNDGPPYRSLPPIPEPKVRDKARYTVMLIGESGTARQLELTGFRLRVIGASVAAVAIVLLVLVIGWGGLFNGGSNRASKDVGGANKALMESVKGKKGDSIQSAKENKPGEGPVSALNEPAASQLTTEPAASRAGSLDGTKETIEGPPSGITELGKSTKGSPQLAVGGEDKLKGQRVAPGSEPVSKPMEPETKTSSSADRPDSPGVQSRIPMVNFNAQEVVASSDSPNGGTLSFRLVKDQPETRFEGYLFVYVEMEDSAGENKIYVYPKQTRLGDGDLPFDYKDGESIAFKYNSRVELPYGDNRQGATLAGVSILLYGEQGKIVFQRTFGRNELSMVNTKNSKAEKPKTRPGEKRQAL